MRILILLIVLLAQATTGKETPELHNDGDEDIGHLEERSLTGDSDWDHMIKGFREVLVRGMLIAKDLGKIIGKTPAAKLGMMAHPVGIATVMVITIIEMTDNSEAPWQKLEAKLTKQITSAIADYHQNDLDAVWNMVSLKARMVVDVCREFNTEDLEYVLANGVRFFPQNYAESSEYDPRWIEKNLQYLSLLNSIYIGLMEAKRMDRCAWARELWHLKSAVINAARSLVRARWKSLEMANYYGGKITGPISGEKLQLSFRDPVRNKEYDGIPLPDIEETVYKPIAEDTKEYLMSYINRFNNLMGGSFTPRGDNLTCETEVVDYMSFDRGFYFNIDNLQLGEPGQPSSVKVLNAETGTEEKVPLCDEGHGRGRAKMGDKSWKAKYKTGDRLILKDESYCKPEKKNVCTIKVDRISNSGKYFFAKRLSISGINFINKVKIPIDVTDAGFPIPEENDEEDEYKVPVNFTVQNGRNNKKGEISVSYDQEIKADADDNSPRVDEFIGYFAGHEDGEGNTVDPEDDDWRVDDVVIIRDKTFCNRGCNPPDPIKWEDLEVEDSYPRNCLDAEEACDFPCGSYNHGSKWCPSAARGEKFAKKYSYRVITGWPQDMNRERNKKTSAEFKENIRKQRFIDPCKEPDWSKCFQVDRLPLIDWATRLERIGREKLSDETTAGCKNFTTIL